MSTTYTVNMGGLTAAARKVIGDVKTFEDVSQTLQSDSGSIGGAVGTDCPDLSSAVEHYFAVMGLALGRLVGLLREVGVVYHFRGLETVR